MEKPNKYPSANSDFSGPVLSCNFRQPQTSRVIETNAYLIRLYQKNLTIVKLLDSNLSPESNGFVLIRGGIHWKFFLGELLKRYEKGQRVPPGFGPIKRLPPDLLNAALKLPASKWMDVFYNLRKSGFLPALMPLNKNTCPNEMNWNSIQKFFHDFKGTAQELPGLDNF